MQISFPSKFVLSFSTGFHLNLPLDEFGAFYIDYLQNLADNFFFSLCSFIFLRTVQWLMLSFPLI
jgi:hypothetical protein